MKSNDEVSSSFSNGAGYILVSRLFYSLFMAMLLAHWPWIASRPLPIGKTLTRKQWRKFEDDLDTVSKNQSYTDMLLICLHVMLSRHGGNDNLLIRGFFLGKTLLFVCGFM